MYVCAQSCLTGISQARILEKVKVKVAQSFLTFCDPMDYIVHGII